MVKKWGALAGDKTLPTEGEHGLGQNVLRLYVSGFESCDTEGRNL